MKILVTIPHYFYAQSESSRFKSMKPSAKAERVRLLEQVIDRLQMYWGNGVYGAVHSQKRFEPLASGFTLDIRIVTVKDRHLLDEIRVPASSYRHEQVDIDPLQLGFHCHRLMLENQGNYDLYGYLEDDILIEDGYLLQKIQHLTRCAEIAGMQDALFQPQRFESSLGLEAAAKALYNAILMDWRIDPEVSDKPLAMEFLGRQVVFERASLPHAGCFWINNAQLAQLDGKPNFGRLDHTWVTPLDTAASYAIGTNFKVYKPVLQDFHFLAVRHGSEVISAKLQEGLLTVEHGQPTGWTNQAT